MLGGGAGGDPEEDLEDASEDGPTDYPADGEDDDDDDSSGDDADDEDKEEASKEDEDEEEEEEEHLAHADSTAVASPVVDLVPSAKETEPFDTDESSPEAEVDRLLAIPTPPPSPLTLLSSPLPQIPLPPPLVSSSPLPLPSPLTTSPTDAGAPLGYRIAEIRLRTASPPPLPLSLPLPLPPPIILPCTKASIFLMRAAAPSTYILAPRLRTPPSGTPPILPIPLPTSSLPLPLPSTDRRADVPKAVLPPQKRLCIALGPRFVVGECSSIAAARPTRGFKADYDPTEAGEEIPPTNLAELSQRVIDFVNIVRDRRYYDNTTLLIKREARVSRQAWAQSMDANHRARFEVMTLLTMVSALQTENRELRAANHTRQTQLLETLTQVRALQTQIVVLQRQRIEDNDRLTQHIQHEHDRFREFQRTRDDAPEDADSSS
ncbi:hypothetical protein Tco_0806434 [Tanacetum coccineum]